MVLEYHLIRDFNLRVRKMVRHHSNKRTIFLPLDPHERAGWKRTVHRSTTLTYSMSIPPALAPSGLGSNLGDRMSHLNFALMKLLDVPQSIFVTASSFFETAPVATDHPIPTSGLQSLDLGGDYLNAAALIRTS